MQVQRSHPSEENGANLVVLESCTSCACSASRNVVPLTRLTPSPFPASSLASHIAQPR